MGPQRESNFGERPSCGRPVRGREYYMATGIFMTVERRAAGVTGRNRGDVPAAGARAAALTEAAP